MSDPKFGDIYAWVPKARRSPPTRKPTYIMVISAQKPNATWIEFDPLGQSHLEAKDNIVWFDSDWWEKQ